MSQLTAALKGGQKWSFCCLLFQMRLPSCYREANFVVITPGAQPPSRVYRRRVTQWEKVCECWMLPELP